MNQSIATPFTRFFTVISVLLLFARPCSAWKELSFVPVWEMNENKGTPLPMPAKPRPGRNWTEPLTGMEFVWVEGGCYMMGCGNWTDSCNDDEKPAHEVCVDGFWMGKYEVTIDQYRRFLLDSGDESGVDWNDDSCPIRRDGKYSLSGNMFARDGSQPMIEVSWHGAEKMASWLSGKTGEKFRLPTGAEWEYAARSGGRREKFAGDLDVDRIAWHGKNSEGHTRKVGTKAPNRLGLHDMSGNVWEWCRDWYNSYYYQNCPRDNPTGPSSGSYRVIRGGSWDFGPKYLRAAFRGRYGLRGPHSALYDLGFRLVLPGPERGRKPALTTARLVSRNAIFNYKR